MILDSGQSLETPEEFFIGGSDLITAVLPHPLHGRLVERVFLMVNKFINVEGQRFALSWRDGGVAFYQPVMPGSH